MTFAHGKKLHLETILLALNNSYDLIGITDGEGNVLVIGSESCKRLYGLNASEIIGQNVFDLEEKGILRPSIVKLVLKNRHLTTSIQTGLNGNRLLATGTPILDSNGPRMVLVNVRDLSELHNLPGTSQSEDDELLFINSEMLNILKKIEKISSFDYPILLIGETGTGKDVLAKRIHRLSKRSSGPFLNINCAAIPESLLESELFGYEPGAFTGSLKKGKKGFFELANKGTLFLNEIGELPLKLQAKLLHAIQDQVIWRVGGVSQIPIDVRIIAATNKPLEKLMREGKFREDLYYRLKGIAIHIPPLRKRKDEIIPLAKLFLEQANSKHRLNLELHRSALAKLTTYDWLGNVRELKQFIETLAILCENDKYIHERNVSELLNENCLNLEQERFKHSNSEEVIKLDPEKGITLEEAEKSLIKQALEKTNYNQSKAALLLGISRPTLVYRIKKYGLETK